jgi:endonuclease/exonuclease/phosphatase family metal-dependent hydrolase
MPWLVIGDFNKILHSYEKEGGNPRPEHFMQAFQSALVDCNLFDLGHRGDKFTWHRGLIRERLDRALVNEAWKTKFEGAFLENLPYNRSDHRPLLLCFEEMPMYEANGPSVLRFEARWLKEARFKEIVEEAWENSASSN